MKTKNKTRDQRLKWFNEARFGLMIHWGLYSILGRGEWIMHRERIPRLEYELLADKFKARKYDPNAWVQLAKEAGAKYVVLTTKHHDGFCLFDSQLSHYTASQTAAKRDLVTMFVKACRKASIKVGFYYSLMDWRHPDAVRGLENKATRQRFIGYIHGQVRELCTNYGKIDIMWYDMPWPYDAAGWESKKLNTMVRKLQPDILINDRSLIPEDFDISEQHIHPTNSGRAWEACVTLNDTWGYHASDKNFKRPGHIVSLLSACTGDGGNLLLNIAPKADGVIPLSSVKTLKEVGKWMKNNGQAIYGCTHIQKEVMHFGSITGKRGHLYLHIEKWPGRELVVGGIVNKVTNAKFLASGKPIKIEQKGVRLWLKELPPHPPDPLTTVIALQVQGTPKQVLGPGYELNTFFVR